MQTLTRLPLDYHDVTQNRLRTLFLLLALLWLGSAPAQELLEVISLRHRTAEQVIPLLRPMLAPGGALSGHMAVEGYTK